MTLDKLIEICLEAKEHCVQGDTDIRIWNRDMHTLKDPDILEGYAVDADYDNKGLNIYFDKL